VPEKEEEDIRRCAVALRVENGRVVFSSVLMCLCEQVAVSLSNGMDSIVSIFIICLLIVSAALVAVFAVLEVR